MAINDDGQILFKAALEDGRGVLLRTDEALTVSSLDIRGAAARCTLAPRYFWEESSTWLTSRAWDRPAVLPASWLV